MSCSLHVDAQFTTFFIDLRAERFTGQGCACLIRQARVETASIVGQVGVVARLPRQRALGAR